jgi:alkylation response protein AidB-like acyl-CoA dehydrogenase
MRTRAVRDGDTYVINGAKMFITSGCRADFVTVLTRTGEDAHGGLTFFVVERGTPGYTVSRSLKKTGWRASDTAELSFADVRVPISHRIGDEGSGFVALMQNFQNERLALAFMGHATAEVALHDALAYARERQAFGKPIGKFQTIRHTLADMATQGTGGPRARTTRRSPSAASTATWTSRTSAWPRTSPPGSPTRSATTPCRSSAGHGIHARVPGRAPEPRRAASAHRRRHDGDHERTDRALGPRSVNRRSRANRTQFVRFLS